MLRIRRPVLLGLGVGVLVAPLLLSVPASADVVIDGPIYLAGATSYGVLAATAVTSTGPSSITGDLGVSPQTAITGFPPGGFSGTRHEADAHSGLAQDGVAAAYTVASSLTPSNATPLGDLVGLTLTPGVYSGGELSLSGVLTLNGDANAVWVFQAASTLVTAGASEVRLTGGATSCNVFWRVGSSATLGGGSDFVGTILADVSITAVTGTDVEGRLLARTGAVTIDDTRVTVPAGCADASTTVVATSPAIVSVPPPDAEHGTPYEHDIESEDETEVSYEITGGALPPGLDFDESTGLIWGTPTEVGTFDVTITARNGTNPDAVVSYQIVVAAVLADDVLAEDVLAATGPETTIAANLALALVAAGLGLWAWSRRRQGRTDSALISAPGERGSLVGGW